MFQCRSFFYLRVDCLFHSWHSPDNPPRYSALYPIQLLDYCGPFLERPGVNLYRRGAVPLEGISKQGHTHEADCTAHEFEPLKNGCIVQCGANRPTVRAHDEEHDPTAAA